MELFEYRDYFSKLIGKSCDKCSLRKSRQVQLENLKKNLPFQTWRRICLESCGIASFILIAPDYSNLDWWNRFCQLVVGFSFALELVKILEEGRMLTGIYSMGWCLSKFYDLEKPTSRAPISHASSPPSIYPRMSCAVSYLLLIQFISEQHSQRDTESLVLVFSVQKKKEDKIVVFRRIPDLYERKESCESAGRTRNIIIFSIVKFMRI